jgi:hypothetical protein
MMTKAHREACVAWTVDFWLSYSEGECCLSGNARSPSETLFWMTSQSFSRLPVFPACGDPQTFLKRHPLTAETRNRCAAGLFRMVC